LFPWQLEKIRSKFIPPCKRHPDICHYWQLWAWIIWNSEDMYKSVFITEFHQT